MKQESNSFSFSNFFWDLWCIISVVGIWPRYIEPHCLSTTNLTLEIPHLPLELNDLKILQLSDLHFHSKMSDFFLNKILKRVRKLVPDLILFTGDFVSFSKIEDQNRLRKFLSNLKAPGGCYAVLGNHDYQEYVSVNEKGDYDLIIPNASLVKKGLKRLWSVPVLSKKITDKAKRVNLNHSLLNLLEQTPFKLLHNTTALVPIKNSYLNICGLGEYMLGQFCPETAFETYDKNYPGIILAHNPDAIMRLNGYPGDLVLCGHTHGGQINLLGLNKKFTLMENEHLKKGLWKIVNKWVYINRGLGSVMKFRWFSLPEITLFTLKRSS